MEGIYKRVTWPQFKSFVDDRNLSIQYTDETSHYHLRAIDGNFGIDCHIFQSESSNYSDFEDNYKADANTKIVETDYDGAPLTRPKVTVKGWHYSPRSINWTTSKLGSINNTNCRKEDIGDAGIRFFDDTDTELVKGQSESDADFQARLDTDCVKTVMWFLKLDAPYDIVGAIFNVKAAPTDDAYAFLTVAPDIPSELGGMVPFFEGGLNLSMMLDKEPVYLNGRGAFTMNPDPDYHSNEMWLIVNHPAGQKTQCQVIYEMYKE